MTEKLLQVDDLAVAYPRKGFRRGPVEILHGVSLDIEPGKTLGVVGESGSGKTTIGRAILGLAPITRGTVTFGGVDITHAGRRKRAELAADLQVVFQDPYSSLNPAMEIGQILAEPLQVQKVGAKESRARVAELLDRVGLPSNAITRVPREFSGGQRQRIAIARALALRPKLIVCDEPVSALDLTTQARVLDLFLEIQQDLGVSYLFISHDLDVIRHISHDVAVLYRGDVVERGEAAVVTTSPQHRYTRRLLLASPLPDPDAQAERRALRGRMAAEERVAAGSGVER
ncbi:peptide/nickel transport system ATP-binding protein [Labedella gwakjiensis]|uniref:ABC transporter ATP-binding protein n=1 Tax=Labedella gwakjiensis TaxID=390269 RepID=A0A2P8GXM1_9MICO|nr:ATP-binding cassette domain-containing protein [Labedella gwakjiensis]PSL38707.1 peptide/nickel transport system ATP-binding protein [Labedella gwakjiensis]RUQ86801.1 ABC transporter ATP-binding protein [Labedella gwakjiensis]